MEMVTMDQMNIEDDSKDLHELLAGMVTEANEVGEPIRRVWNDSIILVSTKRRLKSPPTLEAKFLLAYQTLEALLDLLRNAEEPDLDKICDVLKILRESK